MNLEVGITATENDAVVDATRDVLEYTLEFSQVLLSRALQLGAEQTRMQEDVGAHSVARSVA